MRKTVLEIKIALVRETKEYRVYRLTQDPQKAKMIFPDTIYIHKSAFERSYKRLEDLFLRIIE